jgi:hypothetical protein
MTYDDIDTLWYKAVEQSIAAGKKFTRYSFVELLKREMIRDGWRQCAVGQRTTQFCAQLEATVEAKREEIEQLRAERNTAQANLASFQIAWENWRVTHSTAFKDTEIQRLREEIEAEREACAKVCDEIGGRDSDSHAWDAAAAIRARGET